MNNKPNKRGLLARMLASVGLASMAGAEQGQRRKPKINKNGIIDIEELFYLPRGVKRIKPVK